MTLKERIERVLQRYDGCCLDDENDRRTVRDALTHALKPYEQLETGARELISEECRTGWELICEPLDEIDAGHDSPAPSPAE